MFHAEVLSVPMPLLVPPLASFDLSRGVQFQTTTENAPFSFSSPCNAHPQPQADLVVQSTLLFDSCRSMDIDALPLDTPALKPPPGIVPNFQNAPNIHRTTYGVFIFCLIVSTVFVWSRLYTRYFIHKSHGWDDCNVLTMSLYAQADIHQICHSLRGHVTSLS